MRYANCRDVAVPADGPARLAGGTVPVAGGPAAGPGRTAGESAAPITNRGSLLPMGGRVDALSDTVWASMEEVQSVVEWALIEKYLPGDGCEWEVVQHNSRISRRAVSCGGSVVVVEFASAGESAGFVQVQLKGEACERAGTEGVHSLLSALSRVRSCHSPGRRSSRVDWAWDGVPFTPRMVCEAVEAGDVWSGCRSVHGGRMADGNGTLKWLENGEGTTCYCGVRSGAFMSRCYDRRGPVRYELELKERAAAAAGDVLAGDGWASCALWFLGVARYMADFVDRASGVRGSRAELLPWWAAFVTDAERIRPASGCDQREVHIAAQVERSVIHVRRCVARFVRAGLGEWLLKRCEREYQGRWGSEDDEWLRRVCALKGGGFCGLPDEYGPPVAF